MTHRWGGYLLALVVMLAATRARAAEDPGVRRGAVIAALLTVLQVALGVSNVLLATPAWLSALHLANAAALLATLITTTYRAAVPAAAPLRAALAT
jgi:cytochrome c oxidase assembly protein subunit 15